MVLIPRTTWARPLAVALAFALVGCGVHPTSAPTESGGLVPATPTRTPSESATPSPPSPEGRESLSPSAPALEPSSPEPQFAQVTIPATAVRTVLPELADGVQIHRLSASGPLVVFDETGYGGDAGSGRRIWLADMEHETLRVLATGADGDGAWTPQISRQQVAWIEVRYLGDNVWLLGECKWRIVALDLGTGAVHQVAAGVNHRIAGQNAPPPRLALSDGRIAYTVEQVSGTGDDIVIRSFDSNAVLESLPAEGTVHSLALSGSTVAWSEGTLDAGGGFVYDTRLHVARSSSPGEVIATNAFQVAIADGLLAWVSDPARGQSGLVRNSRIWVASTGDLRPAQLPGPRDTGLSRAARWPAVGDGMVTWAEDLSGSGKPDPTGPHLVIWSRRTGTTAQVEPTGGMFLSSVGGGWVCWNHLFEPVALHAARLADLDLP